MLVIIFALFIWIGVVTNLHAQNVGVGTDNPVEFFSVGANSQFRVNSQGNLVMINNVEYNFPGSNSSGTLVNNGTGTLSWTNAPALAVTNFTGTLPTLNGSNLTNLNASNLASGTVPTARLGSGTADATTFLRGDGSWQTPAGGGGALSSNYSINLSGTLNTSFTLIGTISNVEAGTYLVQIRAIHNANTGAGAYSLKAGATEVYGGTFSGSTTQLSRDGVAVIVVPSQSTITIEALSNTSVTLQAGSTLRLIKLF